MKPEKNVLGYKRVKNYKKIPIFTDQTLLKEIYWLRDINGLFIGRTLTLATLRFRLKLIDDEETSDK